MDSTEFEADGLNYLTHLGHKLGSRSCLRQCILLLAIYDFAAKHRVEHRPGTRRDVQDVLK